MWGAISGSYDSGSFSGSKEDYRAPDTTEFKEEFVKAWILSNMGLLFVFHLIFFTIYLVVKLLSIVKIKGFSSKILTFFEYSGLIVFFLMFHM